MSTINAGRWTIEPGAEVTVFLIGMRINNPLRVHRWGPVFTAMPRMLAHLAQHPEAGMLGYHNWFGRTTLMLSYWRSPEHLQRFASDPEAPHAKPWRDFMRSLSGSGEVGIWHETYQLTPGSHEVVYGDMPAFGLGKALGAVPVGAHLRSAKQRLTATAVE